MYMIHEIHDAWLWFITTCSLAGLYNEVVTLWLINIYNEVHGNGSFKEPQLGHFFWSHEEAKAIKAVASGTSMLNLGGEALSCLAATSLVLSPHVMEHHPGRYLPKFPWGPNRSNAFLSLVLLRVLTLAKDWVFLCPMFACWRWKHEELSTSQPGSQRLEQSLEHLA